MDIAWWNVEKRGISGVFLKSMVVHNSFNHIISRFSEQISKFLQLSYISDTPEILFEELASFNRVISFKASAEEVEKIKFKCKNIEEVIQKVRKAVASLPKWEQKYKLEEILLQIQDSIALIWDELAQDNELRRFFKSNISEGEKESLLIWFYKRVISLSTAKVIFSSIAWEEDIDTVKKLMWLFFAFESLDELLKDSKMLLFCVSVITGQNTKSKEWKRNTLAKFLEIPQVIDAILQSQDPDLDQKLRANIENKTLDMFYKLHRRKRAA